MDKKKKLFQIAVAVCAGLVAAIANIAILSAQRPQKVAFVRINKKLDATNRDGDQPLLFNVDSREGDFERFVLPVVDNNPRFYDPRKVFVLWENRYAFFNRPVTRNFEEGEPLLVFDLDDKTQNAVETIGPFRVDSLSSEDRVLNISSTSLKIKEFEKKNLELLYNVVQTSSSLEEANFSTTARLDDNRFSGVFSEHSVKFLKKGDFIFFVFKKVY